MSNNVVPFPQRPVTGVVGVDVRLACGRNEIKVIVPFGVFATDDELNAWVTKFRQVCRQVGITRSFKCREKVAPIAVRKITAVWHTFSGADIQLYYHMSATEAAHKLGWLALAELKEMILPSIETSAEYEW